MTNGTTFPAKTFAAFWAAFWLLMISASLQDALRNPATHWWEPVLWEGSSALIATNWMLLAIRVRGRYAPYLAKPLRWFGAYLRWLPVVVVTWIAMAYAIRTGVYAMMGLSYQHPGWGFVVVYESVKLTIFTGLWLGVLFGVDSYAQWRVQRHRLLQTQRALAEAQLAQLQGQLRPHFLFNALNTVSALMHTDVARADQLVTTLGDLLRISLRTHGNEMTLLTEELRTLALYAEIMRERFRHRVTLSWQTDDTILSVAVPALLLQPLLENAFKHGVERTTTPVHIEVGARRAGSLLQIVVSNSGTLLAEDQKDGVGLRNCRERLSIIYGAAASLVIRNEGDCVAARIAIPLAGVMP
ncbi:histidine kinase [Luteibacter sp. 9133]|uniref:sensor histidine kinase n=1 Tax=Luteibacter sp. 9133 TaxID=1500891 RepID=UPI0005BE3695|nr:histidine kinase [Luteibacter sp. 9133]